jgi:hypothetical protein
MIARQFYGGADPMKKNRVLRALETRAGFIAGGGEREK